MKKLLALLLATIFLLAQGGCGGKETPATPSTTTQEFTTSVAEAIEQAMKLYEEFLAGKRDAIQFARLKESGSEDVTIEDIFLEALKDNPSYPELYAYYDMNGDGIPELHARSNKHLILTYRADELFVWGFYGNAKVLNNCAVITMPVFKTDEGYIVRYFYHEYDFYGNERLEIFFSKWKPNSKGVYDENSHYRFGDEEVSKQEWDALTEPYFSIGEAEIEWISVVDRKPSTGG